MILGVCDPLGKRSNKNYDKTTKSRPQPAHALTSFRVKADKTELLLRFAVISTLRILSSIILLYKLVVSLVFYLPTYRQFKRSLGLSVYAMIITLRSFLSQISHYLYHMRSTARQQTLA